MTQLTVTSTAQCMRTMNIRSASCTPTDPSRSRSYASETDEMLELYRAMRTARQLDKLENELTGRGEAFFCVSGAGHESSAALAPHLCSDDWLHCHYRDKALMLARGLTPADFLEGLLCTDASHSRGRQMSAHMSNADLRILSIVGPVGNNALQAVGVAAAVTDHENHPIVLCSLGDGTTQQGEFFEACAEAARSQLPVLFLVENNQWAISTRTETKTFYSLPDGPEQTFFGMEIERIDGRDAVGAYHRFGTIVERMRKRRGPALAVMDVERLTSHTNADDQTVYRDPQDIRQAVENGDPINGLRKYLIASQVDPLALDRIDREIDADLAHAEKLAISSPEPSAEWKAKRPLPARLTDVKSERRGTDEKKNVVMREAICEVLRNRLQHDPRVTMWGEDIEDPKGDVFGVTRGLSTQFPGRVCNSPLSESTIVGAAVGRALAGERPVAFLQFADFLPLAFNQIASELGSLHWRTDGTWESPVIVMIPCGGYRPGLGPFHAQTLEALAVHTPGVDVFMPSTATDAAGLLNAAFESHRPTLFFYPKSLLNEQRTATSTDVDQQFIPIGKARHVRKGDDITLVGWGNTVRICSEAATVLEKASVDAEVIDLRSLSPWDQDAVLQSARRTGKLVVVHEDNHSCGMGAEVVATVIENADIRIEARRVTRPDTHIPCNFSNQLEILPSLERVLIQAAELLDLSLQRVSRAHQDNDIETIRAIGSGPADEEVVVVDVLVEPGQTIQRGDTVAQLEATKAIIDLSSSFTGIVDEVLVVEGESVSVGDGVVLLRSNQLETRKSATESGGPDDFLVRKKYQSNAISTNSASPKVSESRVGLSTPVAVTGSRVISNEMLAELMNADSSILPDEIFRRTGIESRKWADADEGVIDLAARACRTALTRQGLDSKDLDLVILSTTTPSAVTPSMACRVLGELGVDHEVPALDINAACSGYLYGLRIAWDFLRSQPEGRVLLVTSEMLSRILNMKDPNTAMQFGDAATATVLYGERHIVEATAELSRPTISGSPDTKRSLSVPFIGDGTIEMKGTRVFNRALRSMTSNLLRTCQQNDIDPNDLCLLVPHQANQHLIDALARRTKIPAHSAIKRFGNTSSSSIPLCLNDVFEKAEAGASIGLCAFGGGFTSGAAIVRKR